MQGTIAQTVALTVYGNSILQSGSESDSLQFQRHNNVFSFCEFVKFVDVVPGSSPRKETVYAASPHEWFERLRKERVSGLRMTYGASGGNKIATDRVLVAFVGGGGKWLIEACGPQASDYWVPRWQLGERGRKDKRIWRVSYIRVLTGARPTRGEPADDLSQLKVELKKCLEEIAEFSRSHKLDPFTKLFESSMARLESPAPLEGLYHEGFVPPGFLPLRATQLLGSADAAWVFGGMGSWNDQSFQGETQAQYERVSEALYQILNQVIAAAANSNVKT
jgi:hypothetical protein